MFFKLNTGVSGYHLDADRGNSYSDYLVVFNELIFERILKKPVCS
jgi:hypothetical protein